MEQECIHYRKGYKYQLAKSYALKLPQILEQSVNSDFIQLYPEGHLVIQKGYAWDGASGPAPDTPSLMRATLIHDALYQLMREEHISADKFRKTADRLLYRQSIEDGLWPAFAALVYLSVRVFGNPSADPANRKQLCKTPPRCEF